MTRSTAIKYLDPEPGWFVLDVMRKEARKSDWAALMIDVDPDELENCANARHCWVEIPGKHRNRDSA